MHMTLFAGKKHMKYKKYQDLVFVGIQKIIAGEH